MQVYLQLPRRNSYMWPSGQIYSIDVIYVHSGCEITVCGKIPITPVAGRKLRVCLTGSYSTGINAPRETHTEMLVKNKG